jgi:hypothetical protein
MFAVSTKVDTLSIYELCEELSEFISISV